MFPAKSMPRVGPSTRVKFQLAIQHLVSHRFTSLHIDIAVARRPSPSHASNPGQWRWSVEHVTHRKSDGCCSIRNFVNPTNRNIILIFFINSVSYTQALSLLATSINRRCTIAPDTSLKIEHGSIINIFGSCRT
jgi:hypothetical protein